MRDLWTSKRDKFSRCLWYSQIVNEDIILNSQIAYKKHPSGVFYAKEINSYNISNQIIENNFQVHTQTVTLETSDDIRGMQRNDKVVYEGREWRVDSIQIEPKRKQKQLMKNSYSNVYYVSIRS